MKKLINIFASFIALAAVAGALLCSAYPALSPTTGAMPGIKAFTAAVIGGIGSIPGAMLGGILLGIVECISYKITVIAPYTDAIEFSVLIIILLVRPTGFLGKKRREKV
jgi:branched-chain amino acid transport system permease protein